MNWRKLALWGGIVALLALIVCFAFAGNNTSDDPAQSLRDPVVETTLPAETTLPPETLPYQAELTEWAYEIPEYVTPENYVIQERTVYSTSTLETTTSTETDTLEGWELVSTVEADGGYGPWSDWSPEEVTDSATRKVQKKDFYKYREKKTTTSSSSEKAGWTYSHSTQEPGEYGSWSGWATSQPSQKENRVIEGPKTQYRYQDYWTEEKENWSNWSEWQNSRESADGVTKLEETRTVWPYYYFLCSNCGAHMHGYGTCFTWAGGCGAPTYESGWHEIWVPMAWSDAGLTDWYGTGKYYTYINGQRYFQLSNAGSKPQYRYKTCSITTVEKYGEPTEWSFEREAQKPGRIESERKVYRYKDREMQVVYHFYKWGEWDKEWTEEALSRTDTRDRKEKLFYRYCDLITETTYYFERWTTPTEFLPEPAEPSDTLRVETKQEYCYRSKTEAEKRNPYADVAVMDAWFEAAMWVTEQGIMNGTSADTFDPNGTVTRGQMVMMLWRAAGKPAPEAAECPYQDVPEDSVFLDAVMWAAQEGIAGGATADTFGLDEVCIQGQAITFLYRAAGKPEVSLTQEPFADVEPDDYYYEPVLWAYERSISSGTSATEFGVNAPCTRTQVAVMLYRTFADK